METPVFRIWDTETRTMIYSDDAWVAFVFHEHTTDPEAYFFDQNTQVWKWLPLRGPILMNTSLRENAVPRPDLLPEAGSRMLVLSKGAYNQDWPSKDQFSAREQPWQRAIAAGKQSWN